MTYIGKEVVKSAPIKGSRANKGPSKLYVLLSKNNIQTHFAIYKLVLNAFAENPHNYSRVRYIDGNYENNKLTNLEWVSESDWVRRGRKQPVNKKGVAVRCVQTGKVYPSLIDASRDTGLYQTAIRNSCEGRTKYTRQYTTWEYVDEEKDPKNKVQQIDNLQNEVWRPVPRKGFETLYSISNMGRLKSHHTPLVEKLIQPIIMKKTKERTETTEFLVNNLHNDKDILNVSISRLVAEVFVANPHNYTDIRFVDGNSSNCQASNLKWYDAKNERHQRAKEIAKLYSDHYTTKRKPVRCIETKQEFESMKDAERRMNIDAALISAVCNGKPHAHTAGGYHWEFVDKNDSYNPKVRQQKVVN